MLQAFCGHLKVQVLVGLNRALVGLNLFCACIYLNCYNLYKLVVTLSVMI